MRQPLLLFPRTGPNASDRHCAGGRQQNFKRWPSLAADPGKLLLLPWASPPPGLNSPGLGPATSVSHVRPAIGKDQTSSLARVFRKREFRECRPETFGNFTSLEANLASQRFSRMQERPPVADLSRLIGPLSGIPRLPGWDGRIRTSISKSDPWRFMNRGHRRPI
jgi:hypothetical protein